MTDTNPTTTLTSEPEVVIRIESFPQTWWLQSFDNVTGVIELTASRSAALGFPLMSAAMDYRRQTLASDPVREDGKPNRPLTGFTVTFMAR